MTGRWLVPLDGSTAGESALPWAVHLAKVRGAALVLAQTFPWPPIVSNGFATGGYLPPDIYEEMLDAERATATDYLQQVRSRLSDQGVPIEIAVREGSAYSALLDLADELNVDGFIMATHGRTGLRRVVLGSVANAVVQHATIPVLLVRSGAADARVPATRRLLVPLDGSALAERALDAAVQVARSDGSLLLVRVEDADREQAAVAARSYLQNLQDALAAQRVQAAHEIRAGRPAEQILEAARTHDADVIVMATHGRSGPARWLLGSVADEVVREADRPVLLVSARALIAHAPERTVGDLLTGEPAMVGQDESLAVVLRKLLRQRTPAVGVMDAHGELAGVISERELTDWYDATVTELSAGLAEGESPPAEDYARRLQANTAWSIMVRPSAVLDASTPLQRALHLFRERGLARLPITRDGKLAGFLTRADMLKVMAAQLGTTPGGTANPSD